MTRTRATAAPVETPSAVIDRISLVLDAFEGPGRLTLAQIVRRTGLPRSSAHRMLERLVQLRWLRRSGRDYELGMRLVELGSLAVHQDRLVRAARRCWANCTVPPASSSTSRSWTVPTSSTWTRSATARSERSRPGSADVNPRTAPPSARRSSLTATSYETDKLTCGSARPSTRYRPTRSWPPSWPRCGRTASRSSERSHCSDSVASQPVSESPGEAVAAVSVCGPMNRMMFDQRLAAPYE